ncbi:hypothetical protein BKA65DRAFT_533786 [Rhexocercosporidium sp. MPI-PUGE-AT-0058]|nr:hypothetical protein BKA65DRAFT_533786 [Rhexocercosporidium sp. MPI-PUGE-AT-0058]
MTSISSATRPVLGDLNANTPLSRTGAQGLKASKGSSPTKPPPMAEVLPQASLPEARKYGSTDEKAPVLGAKRKSYSADDAVHGSPKRLKETTGTEEDGGSNLPVQLLGGDVQEVRELLQTSSQAAILGHHDDPSTAPTSPASSFTSQDNSGLNDSQNTTITIPDDSPQPPRPSPLTGEELRRKAREIKLRLSLASYKVRTNQIDIPISRLEIRSSSTSSRIPPLPRCATNSSQTQDASRPSSAPQIPNINLQIPSAEKKRPQSVTIPSSPPSYPSTLSDMKRSTSPTKVANDATREGFATPLLPRQRQGVLNPPSLGGSPSWEDRGSDLNSSVVKGRAADGLLCLMRQ